MDKRNTIDYVCYNKECKHNEKGFCQLKGVKPNGCINARTKQGFELGIKWRDNKIADLEAELAVKDIEIERLKQNYDEVWEDTYFSVREEFELNNNCNECRRYYAEEFNKQIAEKDAEVQSWKDGTIVVKLGKLEQQLAEKDQAIESLQEINQSLGQTCNNDAKEIERLREQLEEKEREETKRMQDFEKGCKEYYKSNQRVIDELEKVKDFIIKNNEPNRKMTAITRFINQQINDLRGN